MGLKDWFKTRAIQEVDSWDGSASNYKDAHAYCSACLIDVNDSTSEPVKNLCMLPVKMPGSNMMADKGIMAAAGGHGITQLRKPANVPRAKWDAALKKAANTIISGYNQMDKQAPDAVYELAGKTPPQRAISIDSVFQQVQNALMESMQQMYGMASMETPDYGYLMTLYIDGGDLYALFNHEGLLNRAAIDIGDNDVVTLGPPESVAQQFQPVQRNSFTIVRQMDGRTRFFMIAATAIINREGEIDSTRLFDDFIRRAEATGYYPRLDFFHLGSVHPAFEFGTFDYLAREGYAYVTSGLFDEDNPLSEATRRAWERDPAAWGASIEYYPANDGVEYMPLAAGMEVAVFTAGLNTRISLLPEQNAAGWFTSVLMERNMDEKKLKALRSLFGDNEAGFIDFLAGLGTINTDVENRGLIARSTDKKTEPEPEKTEPEKTEPVEPAPELTLDDEAIQAIARQMETTVTGELKKGITDLTALFAEFKTQLSTLRADVDKRLAGLERTDSEKQREWVADLPSRKVANVTYRPREVNTNPQPLSADEIAKKTLERIPQIGA